MYQKAIDRLVDIWYQRLSGAEAGRLKQQMFTVLGAVAYHVHLHKPSGVIPEPEFKEVFRRELAHLASGTVEDMLDALLRAMRDDVGLLAASAPGAYRFCHLTFQEYLAAQHLMNQSGLGAERIVRHMGDPRWHEPILMLLGLANWQYPAQLADLTTLLLNANGPLEDMFPESALLMADAVPQMTNVAPNVVTAIVGRLLTSLTELVNRDRLPNVQGLIAEAIRQLRSGDQQQVVDDVLASALLHPPGGAFSVCATAALIRSLGIATPQIASALNNAASTWDLADLDFPIASALVRVVSPGQGLDPDLALPNVKIRAALRRHDDLVARIREDRRWLALVTCVSGGYPDLDTRENLRQYNLIVNYLALDEQVREGFVPYFALVWKDEDPNYRMAVHVDLQGRRKPPAVEFTADAIVRDSPYTDEILRCLRRDDLPALVRFLSAQAAEAGTGDQAAAAFALWAVGQGSREAADSSTDDSGIEQRIAALQVTLRDAAVRAAGTAGKALAAASHDMNPGEWSQLFEAVTTVLLHAGAEPFTVDDPGMPAASRHRALVEELSHRFNGWGDDPLYNAAVFADTCKNKGYSPQELVAALSDLGDARHARYGLYANWWPADPVAFPHRDERDIPIGVLDLAGRVPGGFPLARSWIVQDLLPPLADANQELLPELLAVRLAEHTAYRADTEGVLDAAFEASSDPVGYILGLTENLTSAWHRARALARLAEMCPDDRTALAAQASEASMFLTDPRQQFEMHEWLARLAPTPEMRQSHVDACESAAGHITDAVDAVLAWIRVARLNPPESFAGFLTYALSNVGRIQERDEQARILLLIHERYADDPGVHAAVDATIAELLGSADKEYATGQFGAVLTRYLPFLARATETGTQTWTPVALYARSITSDVCKHHEPAAAGPISADTLVARLMQFGQGDDSQLIQASGALVRQVDAALSHVPARSLQPVLNKLVNPDPDSEPIIRRWLLHPNPVVSQIAALLLAEYRDLTPDLLEPLVDLLRSDSDVIRHRTSLKLGPTTGPEHALSRIGAATAMRAASLATEVGDDEPAIAQRINWMLNTVLIDVPVAVASWCDAIDSGDQTSKTAAKVLDNIRYLTAPVWQLMLDRLSIGTPRLQLTLLTSIASLVYRSAEESGRWSDNRVNSLRMNAERWEEFWDTTDRIDLTKLAEPPFLILSSDAVVDAVAASLTATSGALTEQSIELADGFLRAATATTFQAILSAPEDAARQALYRLGKSSHYQPGAAAASVARHFEATRDGEGADWPWVQLLVHWTRHLLAESVNDLEPDYGPAMYLRTEVLEITAAAADLSKATFRKCADGTQVSSLLAGALRYQRSFTARRAAAQLLGLLRQGSEASLGALEAALADVSYVNAAALAAIPRLRHVDQRVIDNLAATLFHPSSMVAWSAAQLLATIGQDSNLTSQLRGHIIGALAAATQDPRSRRTVHFSYAPGAIPDMPELDDTFAEALRRLYHFGERAT